MRLLLDLKWIPLVALLLCLVGEPASAQFTQGLPPSPLPQNNALQNQPVTSKQIQQMMMLRYLQQRSGGGVKRGTPQMIPFGNPFMGSMMAQQQQQQQTQQGFGGQTADPQAKSGKKSTADKKADAQAAREERKRLARERAEQRKKDAADRRAKANKPA